MSKFLGVSLLNSASQKGRAWEHGPGTPSELLSSRSFSERKGVLEKAFYLEVPWGVPFCFGGKRESTWEHKARPTQNSFSETPFPNTRFKPPQWPFKLQKWAFRSFRSTRSLRGWDLLRFRA